MKCTLLLILYDSDIKCLYVNFIVNGFVLLTVSRGVLVVRGDWGLCEVFVWCYGCLCVFGCFSISSSSFV